MNKPGEELMDYQDQLYRLKRDMARAAADAGAPFAAKVRDIEKEKAAAIRQASEPFELQIRRINAKVKQLFAENKHIQITGR